MSGDGKTGRRSVRQCSRPSSTLPINDVGGRYKFQLGTRTSRSRTVAARRAAASAYRLLVQHFIAGVYADATVAQAGVPNRDRLRWTSIAVWSVARIAT